VVRSLCNVMVRKAQGEVLRMTALLGSFSGFLSDVAAVNGRMCFAHHLSNVETYHRCVSFEAMRHRLQSLRREGIAPGNIAVILS
jgi:hypothetical protein